MIETTGQTKFIFVPGITDYLPADLKVWGDDLKEKDPARRRKCWDYSQLADVLAGAGYRMTVAQPDWKNTYPDAWVDAVVAKTKEVACPAEPVVIGGFSFGAVVAAGAAERLRPEYHAPCVLGVMAASVSCLYGNTLREFEESAAHDEDKKEEFNYFFGEDENGERRLLPRTLAVLKSLRLPALQLPVQVYIGANEVPLMFRSRDDALANWPRAERIPDIPNAWHSIVDTSYEEPYYLNAIAANVGSLATA